jgi:hypothetical protein
MVCEAKLTMGREIRLEKSNRSERVFAVAEPMGTELSADFPQNRRIPAVYTTGETRYICSAPQPDNGVRLGF